MDSRWRTWVYGAMETKRGEQVLGAREANMGKLGGGVVGDSMGFEVGVV